MFDTDPMLMNQMNGTSIRQYFLGILRFNSSDRGYYWCQMVVNNMTLSPSPYGYFNDSQCPVQNVTCNLDQPLCAQNTRAQYMAFRQENGCSLINVTGNIIWPTRETTVSPVVTSSITTLDITNVTMSSFPTTEVTSAIVAGIILLVLTIIVILSIIYVKKHRSESELIIYDNHIIMYLIIIIILIHTPTINYILGKEHEVIVHHYAKIELNECEEANDISNPHYTEVRIATDQSHLPPMNEETTVANDSSEMGDSGLSKTEYYGSNVSIQQHSHSEADQIAQINDDSSDQTESQDSHKIQTETDVSLEYAVVDKSKKTSRLQSNGSTATRADSAMENNHYDKLKQDSPAKPSVTSEDGKDQVREKSPSPTYAELSVREKIPKVSKYQTEVKVQQKNCELESHEYASMDQASAKVTKEEPEEVEQHYYYTLENPEESCSDSKGKEEIINTGENKYDMLQQFHHLVIQEKSVAPNTDEEAELAAVKEINATPLDSHPEEAHTDKANS